ncbi:MAG: glycosyltransferase family 4 protein [Desulfococcaceae bacterium]
MLKNDLINTWHYIKNRCNFIKKDKKTARIVFHCGFHGESGGPVAISAIANILSRKYHVEFVSFPKSNYNPRLDYSVRIVRCMRDDADLYIFDVSSDPGLTEMLIRNKKKCIVSCHGLYDSLHGLKPERVMQSLLKADKVHFVSRVQQESFGLKKGHFFIIPNTNHRIIKTKSAFNIGIIGNAAESRKNIKNGISLALGSKAQQIHVWGSDSEDIPFSDERIIVHSWERSKNRIYNSFDVLVSLSRNETFGLTVIEAMSAGIPCLLSDIPAFRQFRECPGIVLTDSDEKNAAAMINFLLDNRDEFHDKLIRYWEDHYSEDVIAKKWFQIIESMI